MVDFIDSTGPKNRNLGEMVSNLCGHIPVPELKDRLQLDSVPEEERGRYHTLSGMMMLLTGRLPKVADTIEWQGWKFEIVDMDGKTIDKVLATNLSAKATDSAAQSVTQ